jgi:hypothetical protein
VTEEEGKRQTRLPKYTRALTAGTKDHTQKCARTTHTWRAASQYTKGQLSM